MRIRWTAKNPRIQVNVRGVNYHGAMLELRSQALLWPSTLHIAAAGLCMLRAIAGAHLQSLIWHAMQHLCPDSQPL